VISKDIIFAENKVGIPNYLDLPSSKDDIFPTFIQAQTTPLPKEIFLFSIE